jgi:hypothetical protein
LHPDQVLEIDDVLLAEEKQFEDAHHFRVPESDVASCNLRERAAMLG